MPSGSVAMMSSSVRVACSSLYVVTISGDPGVLKRTTRDFSRASDRFTMELKSFKLKATSVDVPADAYVHI